MSSAEMDTLTGSHIPAAIPGTSWGATLMPNPDPYPRGEAVVVARPRYRRLSPRYPGGSPDREQYLDVEFAQIVATIDFSA